MPATNEIVPEFDDEAGGNLEVSLRRVGGDNTCLLVKLRGSVDSFSADYLRRGVFRAIECGFIRLIFDLDNVDHVASMGIGVLIAVQKAVSEKGGDLTLSNVQPKVMTVLKLMCLDSFFRCAGSADRPPES